MASSPVKQLQGLLLWCRREKIQISSLQIGNLTVTVERDYLLQPPASATQGMERRPNIIEQHAGPLLAMMRGEQPAQPMENEPTEEDE